MTTLLRIHPTADVSTEATIGPGTNVWHEAQIRERARIGHNCNIGKGAYIDFDVVIGDNVKIQNRASIYHGTMLEDGVFVGPHVVFTNDRNPRSINSDGSPKTDDDWEVGQIVVQRGASIGAGSVILPGVSIGEFALIGAGSVVTRDVPAFAVVFGNPARLRGHACACGFDLDVADNRAVCTRCGLTYDVTHDAKFGIAIAPHERS